MVIFIKDIKTAKRKKLPRPKVPEYVGECLLLIAQRLSMRPNFINYCVDDKTEALTKRGWLKYNEITFDDKILSIGPSKKLIWGGISDIFINKKYNGKVFKLKHKFFECLVTPGHRFLTKEKGLIRVEDLVSTNHIILMGKEIEDKSNDYSDSFIELLGWFVAEGNTTNYKRSRKNTSKYKKSNIENSHYIKIFQNRNTENYKRIKNCLNILQDDYTEYTKSSQGFGLSLELSEKINTVCPDKILDLNFLFSLTQKQRLLFLTAFDAGDGSGKFKEKHLEKIDSMQFGQKRKDIIDRILILTTLSGLYSHTKYQENFHNFNGYNFISKMWNVSLSQRKSCLFESVNFIAKKRKSGGDKRSKSWLNKENIPILDYKGVVWCPKTNYGNFICRRECDDKSIRIFCTGNTYRDDMVGDGLENCLTYIHNFDSKKSSNPFAYFTQIIYFAFLRRIQKEKKQSYIKHKVLRMSSMSEDLTTKNLFDEDTAKDGKINLSYLDNNKINDLIASFEDSDEEKALKKLNKLKKKLKIPKEVLGGILDD